MNSKERFIGIVVLWSLFGLLTGIICHQGGVQIEDVLLTGLLAFVALGVTALLGGVSMRERLTRISTLFPPFDR